MFSLAVGINYVLAKLFQRLYTEEKHPVETTTQVTANNSSSPAYDTTDNFLDRSREHDSEKEVAEDIVVKIETGAVNFQSIPKLKDNEGESANEIVELDGVADVSHVEPEDVEFEDVDDSSDDIVRTSWLEQPIHGVEEVPYLSDPTTIKFIRHSTTMFIMRGLPGSGKTTIVRFLQHLYPKSVVCSADDYFLRSNGGYRYDMTKLSEAHAHCQDKATENCENRTPVIIIDNTNIQKWEMSFYLRLGQNRYHTFIVEPKTPWRHDVMELSKRNKHGVDVDILQQKLQKLQGQKVFPLYYGWFLTNTDSSNIVKMAKNVLSECVKDLENTDDGHIFNTLNGILEDFVICYTDPKGMLHCTSKFVGSNTHHPYHQRNTVNSSIGKVFNLEIAGFVYTGRSISARVNLNSGLYKHEAAIDLYDKAEEESLRDRYAGHSRKDQIQNHFGHACSSHITIKVANDAQSKVSGEDILRMCEMGFHGKGAVSPLGIGRLHSFPDNMFYLELDTPATFRTLFHGYFSTSRR